MDISLSPRVARRDPGVTQSDANHAKLATRRNTNPKVMHVEAYNIAPDVETYTEIVENNGVYANAAQIRPTITDAGYPKISTDAEIHPKANDAGYTSLETGMRCEVIDTDYAKIATEAGTSSDNVSVTRYTEPECDYLQCTVDIGYLRVNAEYGTGPD